MVKVNFKKLDKNAHAPTYGSEFAAGADLYALTNGETVRFSPGETKMIHTGLAVEIPVGYAGLIYARSGIATKRGLAPANKVGVIDSDYFGSDNEGHIIVKLTNCGDKPLSVKKYAPFCQGVFLPFGITESDATDGIRNGGFGSTSK